MKKVKLTKDQRDVLYLLHRRKAWVFGRWYLPEPDENKAPYTQLMDKGLVSIGMAKDHLDDLTSKEQVQRCYQLTDEGRALAWELIKNGED